MFQRWGLSGDRGGVVERAAGTVEQAAGVVPAAPQADGWACAERPTARLSRGPRVWQEGRGDSHNLRVGQAGGELQGCRGATQAGGLTPFTLALRCGKCSRERPAGWGEGWASAEEEAIAEEGQDQVRGRPWESGGGAGSWGGVQGAVQVTRQRGNSRSRGTAGPRATKNTALATPWAVVGS